LLRDLPIPTAGPTRNSISVGIPAVNFTTNQTTIKNGTISVSDCEQANINGTGCTTSGMIPDTIAPSPNSIFIDSPSATALKNETNHHNDTTIVAKCERAVVNGTGCNDTIVEMKDNTVAPFPSSIYIASPSASVVAKCERATVNGTGCSDTNNATVVPSPSVVSVISPTADCTKNKTDHHNDTTVVAKCNQTNINGADCNDNEAKVVTSSEEKWHILSFWSMIGTVMVPILVS
jgi:hypothetical protein